MYLHYVWELENANTFVPLNVVTLSAHNTNYTDIPTTIQLKDIEYFEINNKNSKTFLSTENVLTQHQKCNRRTS